MNRVESSGYEAPNGSVAMTRVLERGRMFDDEPRALAQGFYAKMGLSEVDTGELEYMMLSRSRVGATWEGYLNALRWYVEECKFPEVHNWISDLTIYSDHANNPLSRLSGGALISCLKETFSSCLRMVGSETDPIISREHAYRFICIAVGRGDPGEGCLRKNAADSYDVPVFRGSSSRRVGSVLGLSI